MSAIETEVGVGRCAKRPEGFGHVWAGANASGDRRNPCRFGCGVFGRDFFKAYCQARMAMFEGVVLPMESGTGKPRDLTDAQRAKVEEILADKRRRDAEAVENGTARPGQVIGVKARTS